MKWTKDCGKEPCSVCCDDWEYIKDWPELTGTIIIPACGDGCCTDRSICDWCNGTGIEPEEE